MNDERSGCSAILYRLFGGSGRATVHGHTAAGTPPPTQAAPAAPRVPEHRYRLREDFVSRAEASFFHSLRTVVGDRALIFLKVNLADLLYPPRQEQQRAVWNRINRKHIDFVLCDPRTLAPVLAVELDDRSHRRQDRVERDAFLDDALGNAGLPLLRVPARQGYSPQALAAELSRLAPQVVHAQGAAAAPPTEITPPPAPVGSTDPTDTGQVRPCERCGGEMRVRVARQGTNAGNRFWGCENYPRCRNVVAL